MINQLTNGIILQNIIRKHILQNIFKFILLGIVLASLWFLKDPALELLHIAKERDAIIAYVDGIGYKGVLVLAIAIFLQMVIAAIPGHLLMFTAGYLYGFATGFLMTWIMTVIASQFTFHLARKAGRPLIYRLASPKLIEKWEKVAKRQGIIFFIFSFNLPIFPADVMSYVAGFCSISASRFFLANLIGHLPTAILMNLAGAYGFELSPLSIAILVGVSLLLFLVWLKYGNHVNEKFGKEKGGK